jgi:hypothetical protein
MKKLGFGLAFAFVLAIFLMFLTRPREHIPYYVSITSQPIGTIIRDFGDVAKPVPIQDGKLWMWALTSNTSVVYHRFFYDLNQRRVIGELFNANALFENQDESKLFCQELSPPPGWLPRLGAKISRISYGKISVFPSNYVESLWLLDLRKNLSVCLGRFLWNSTQSHSWIPAPGFHYVYDSQMTSPSPSFLLCDLEKRNIRRVDFVGTIEGWWDETNLVVQSLGANDYSLFNVASRKSAPFIKRDDIQKFLQSQGLNPQPGFATLFNWSDEHYEMYLTGSHGILWGHTNATFLIKVRHGDPRFTLVCRDFSDREPSACLDSSGTHYLYSGAGYWPSSTPIGNGSVVLRDLTNHSERALVPPNNGSTFAFPAFFSDSIIYWQNPTEWRLDLKTGNSSQLLPISGK